MDRRTADSKRRKCNSNRYQMRTRRNEKQTTKGKSSAVPKSKFRASPHRRARNSRRRSGSSVNRGRRKISQKQTPANKNRKRLLENEDSPPRKKKRLLSEGGVQLAISDHPLDAATGNGPRDDYPSPDVLCHPWRHPERKLPCWVAVADLEKGYGAFSTNECNVPEHHIPQSRARRVRIPKSIRATHRTCGGNKDATMDPFQPRIPNHPISIGTEDFILSASDPEHINNCIFDKSTKNGVNGPSNNYMGRTGFFRRDDLRYYLKESLNSPLAKVATDKLNDPNLFLQQVTYVHYLPVDKIIHWAGRWIGNDLVEVFLPGSIVVTFEYNGPVVRTNCHHYDGTVKYVKLRGIFPRRGEDDYWALRGLGAKYATYNINYLG